MDGVSSDLQDLGLVDSPAEEEFDNITEFVCKILQAPVALVSIVEPDRDRQYFKSSHGLPEPWASRRETPLSHSFCKYVRALGAPLIIEDAREHALVRDSGAVGELALVAYLGMPILDASNQSIGALCAIENTPRQWSDEDIEALRKLATLVNDQIRLRAILRSKEKQLGELQSEIANRGRLETELKRQASIDPLTGLLNRKAFFERAKAEIARMSRNEQDAAIILIDLDRFKAINDTFGHATGDQVLQAIAARLQASCRHKIDVLARFGGEEFVVLLPESCLEQASQMAERCRHLISEPIELLDGRSLSVTASFGLANLRTTGLDVERGLRNADIALYRAKSQGRNRVAVQTASTGQMKARNG